MILSGTGLTHLGSASTRDAMHSAANGVGLMDSMKMFRMGLENGKPGAVMADACQCTGRKLFAYLPPPEDERERCRPPAQIPFAVRAGFRCGKVDLIQRMIESEVPKWLAPLRQAVDFIGSGHLSVVELMI